jgi:hypothetical protein
VCLSALLETVRTTHRLGAAFAIMFAKWFAEHVNDPRSCVHTSLIALHNCYMVGLYSSLSITVCLQS